MRFEPTRDNMAVLLDDVPTEHGLTESGDGVVLREHATGVVIAIGPGREEYTLTGERRVISAPAKIGDRVLITNGYHCDKPITVCGGRKMIVCISACILAIIKE